MEKQKKQLSKKKRYGYTNSIARINTTQIRILDYNDVKQAVKEVYSEIERLRLRDRKVGIGNGKYYEKIKQIFQDKFGFELE